MLSGMIAAAGGIVVTVLFASLPSVNLLIACLPLVVPLALASARAWRVLGCLLIGIWWGCWRGGDAVARQLPTQLEGLDLLMRVCVEGLPEQGTGPRGEISRFTARLLDAPGSDSPAAPKWRGQRVEISYYGARVFRPGQAWEMVLRLRAPRGFVNPGAGDYQAWLLAQGIQARGYVVQKAPVRQLDPGLCGVYADKARFALRERMLRLLAGEQGLGKLLAISMGDDSRLATADWDVFARTGTTHLMVVSGMHISLVALLLHRLGMWLARALPIALRCWPASKWGGVLAVPGACAYAALAGFSVSAQRALIMVCVFLCFDLLERELRPWLAFALALLAVLVWQPLAAMQTGFWLSFTAVAALILGFSGRIAAASRLELAWKPQLLVMLALAGPLLLAGLSPAPLSPLTNLFAIPLVSVVAVPAALLGVLMLGLSDAGAWLLFKLSLAALDLLWLGLEQAARWSPSLPPLLHAPTWWQLLLAAVGVCWLLAPAGVAARGLGMLLWLPLLWPVPRTPALLELVMLDVGQGTSVILRTRHHTLVYDVGARFSERFDSGADIVAPALRYLGSTRVDMLVVSHSDGDHAGGAAALLRQFPALEMIGGEPLPGLMLDPCIAGRSWMWDTVHFQLLHPRNGNNYGNNDRSCVLRVEAAGRVILLPGDIEAIAESSLLAADAGALRADVLLVPHHGSRSSSTAAFVTATRPRYALVSAGYRNRFGHPHETVLQRYRSRGAMILNTANSGAVALSISEDGGLATPRAWRDRAKRYWFSEAVRD